MNYLKDTEKLLKRFFKKKVKITTGVVVTFLLSCNIANANEEQIQIGYDDYREITFNNQSFKEYHKPDTENRLADNDLISKDNEYTYINTTLSNKDIFLGLGDVNFNFYNKGSIYRLDNIDSKNINIYNSGLIRGNLSSEEENIIDGICNETENNIKKIINIGLIIPGETNATEYNGIFGRGIYNENNASIEEIINLGMIGNTKVKNSGNDGLKIDGITNDSSIDKILNIGIISGTTSSISNKGNIDSIQNIGSIEG